MNAESSSSEPENSQNKSPIGRCRSEDVESFKRNPNLFYIVHALLHLSQFMAVLAIEAFHHVHHLINKSHREDNPKISQLRDERHPIFIAIPICMIMNLFLGFMWVVSTGFWKRIELGLIGTSFGAFLMLLCVIVSMQHAQIYINIELISDEDLIRHPIFIHSFTESILAIFALASYLLHFWLYYESWRWQLKKKKCIDKINKLRREFIHETSSKSTVNPDFLTSPGFSDITHSRLAHTRDKKNVEDEPVILYCFCIDCWNYIRYHHNKQNNVDQCEVETVV